jgi:anti-sigma factor RsiW
MSELERDLEQLHRYHDGELSRLERLLFKRRLGRSPALQGELRALQGVSSQIAQAQLDLEPVGAPDLWAGISSALPAIDAQVAAESAGQAQRAPSSEAVSPSWFGGRGALPGWAVGTAALAVAAVVALVVVVELPGAGPGPGTEPAVAAPVVAGGGGVVRYLDAGSAAVMVIEDPAADMTIVWLIEAV